MSDYIKVPLRARDGSVRAVSLIDAADAPLVMRWRWSLSRAGYAVRAEHLGPGKSSTLPLHRVIVGLERGDDRQVDHINRDKLDNRRANLRICSGALNQQNRAGGYGSSSYRGVTWDKSRGQWMANHRLNGRGYTIGRFATEFEAAAAAAEWRAKHMPFSPEADAA